MSLLDVNLSLPYAEANGQLFDLLHKGVCRIGDREVSMPQLQMPIPTKKSDHISWACSLRVSTPGPDAKLSEIRQYRDRIELDVWPWAKITVRFL